MKERLVIDGCAFCEGEFQGLSEEVILSELDAFFLTVPGEMEGFIECVTEIGKIYNLTDNPKQKVTIVRTYEDIFKAKQEGKKAIILTFQDPYPLGRSFDRLRVFYELGLRVMQLTYNKMNYLGTGCLESNDNGLTDLGKKMVRELNRLGVLIDCSHCSYQTGIDTLKVSEKPIVFSHAGAKVLTMNPRNKTDRELKLLKENGGVIGLSSWGPLCWDITERKQPSLARFVDHIEYVIELIGIDHVGFGGDSTLDNNEDREGIETQSTLYAPVVEDYNRYVGVDPNTRHAIGIKGSWQINNVINEMSNRGYTQQDISKLTGGNFLRVIKQTWK